MPLQTLTQVLLVIFSSFLLLSGCSRTLSPEIGLQELRAQAEERLLQDAKLAFMRAEYPEAVLLFNRFVKTHPHSNLVPEAQWWLARSYEEAGNLRLALARYQRLARSAPYPYAQEAELRARHLIEALGIESVSLSSPGVMMSFLHIPGTSGLRGIAEKGFRQGSRMLIDLGCPIHHLPSVSQEDHGESVLQWRNDFGQDVEGLLVEAVESGYLVFVGVTLRCVGLFGANEDVVHDQWRDWSFDPSARRYHRSPYFSLFSHGYQRAIREWLSRLQETKISGIVFFDEAPLGPYDGFHPLAIKQFEHQFKVTLDPERLFPPSVVRTGQQGTSAMLDLTLPSYPDLFWKWTGWKARERTRILVELIETLRASNPYLQFGVEIHLQSLFAPLYALVEYGEDWVEMAQAPVDVFVVRLPPTTASKERLLSGERAPSNSASFQRDLIKHMIEYLEDPQKVWVIRQVDHHGLQQGQWMDGESTGQSDWPEGVGELLDIQYVP